jgi:hypothetical protein
VGGSVGQPILAAGRLSGGPAGWKAGLWSLYIFEVRQQRFPWTFFEDSGNVSVETCIEQVACDANHDR